MRPSRRNGSKNFFRAAAAQVEKLSNRIFARNKRKCRVGRAHQNAARKRRFQKRWRAQPTLQKTHKNVSIIPIEKSSRPIVFHGRFVRPIDREHNSVPPFTLRQALCMCDQFASPAATPRMRRKSHVYEFELILLGLIGKQQTTDDFPLVARRKP